MNCSSNVAEGEVKGSQLARDVEETVRKMTEIAVSGNGFAAEASGHGEIVGVYGLAQCWSSLSREECGECLEKAGREVRRCLPGRQGRSLNAGCFLRYSTDRIYDQLMVEEGSSDEDKGMYCCVDVLGGI